MPPEFDDEDDIRADLQESFEAIRDGRVSDEGLPIPREGATEEDVQRDRRARDAAGRFAVKDAGADDEGTGGAPDPTKPADTPSGTEDKPAQPAQAAATDIPAPESWSAPALQQHWASLPPEVRAHVADREMRTAERIRTLAEPLRPVAELAQARGIPWQTGLGQLVEAQREFDKSPSEGMLFLAKKFGIDMDELAQLAFDRSQGKTPSATTLSPQSVNPQLEERLGRLETALERQARQSKEDADKENLSFVVEFAKDPTRPHFNAVATEINQLLPMIRRDNPGAPREKILQMAYDRAVWANPTVRASLIASQAASAQQQQQTQQRARNGRAASSLSHVGGPTSGTIPRQPMKNGRFDDDDIRNDILASVDSLSS
jgi:hypothetical protein